MGLIVGPDKGMCMYLASLCKGEYEELEPVYEMKNSYVHKEFTKGDVSKFKANTINYAHIMTYDLNVSSQASHHTNPLAGRAYSAEGSISFYSGAGMPYEKIVIGAGFYGKISELTNPYDQATEKVLNDPVSSTVAIKYSSIKRNYMTDPSYVEYYDSRCGAYYLTNGRNFITYDNPQSIYTKGQLIQKYNLGGMMFWDLGSDDTFELLSAVYGVICDINYGRL